MPGLEAQVRGRLADAASRSGWCSPRRSRPKVSRFREGRELDHEQPPGERRAAAQRRGAASSTSRMGVGQRGDADASTVCVAGARRGRRPIHPGATRHGQGRSMSRPLARGSAGLVPHHARPSAIQSDRGGPRPGSGQRPRRPRPPAARTADRAGPAGRGARRSPRGSGAPSSRPGPAALWAPGEARGARRAAPPPRRARGPPPRSRARRSASGRAGPRSGGGCGSTCSALMTAAARSSGHALA
jgi:hypothetical protein